MESSDSTTNNTKTQECESDKMTNSDLVSVELEDGSFIRCKKVKKFGYRVPKYKPEYLDALKQGEDVEMPVSCAETPTRFHNRENAIRFARRTKDDNIVFLSPTEVEKKKGVDWLAD